MLDSHMAAALETQNRTCPTSHDLLLDGTALEGGGE